MTLIERWKARARHLKREVTAVAVAARDPRTPWYAKLLALGIVAYALSPLDLIPDPIPILGYLDDLILLPLAIVFVLRLIPREVMAEAREHAANDEGRAVWAATLGAALILLLWLVTAGLLVYLGLRMF